MLASLNGSEHMRACTEVLTSLIQYDERYSAMARQQATIERGVQTSNEYSVFSTKFDTYSSPSTFDSADCGADSGEEKATTADSTQGSVHDHENEHVEYLDSEEKSNGSDNPAPVSASISSSANTSQRKFMWGIWQTGSEITLLLDESDADLFPEGAVTCTAQRWRVVKLSGRPIQFEETGLVAAMTASQLDDATMGVSFNISTATTNCTLVPDEILEPTLSTLSVALNCVKRITRDPQSP
jgi:hypothetical protein